MKKQLLLLVLLMGLFATTYAQDKKMFAGVNLGFSSKENQFSNFNIGPKFGYWLSDNSAIVGRIGFSSNNNKAVTPNVTTTDFSIGAQLRYGWHMGDHTFFYLAPGVNFGSSKNDLPNAKATTTFTVDLTPGVDYMLGDSWSINAEIGLLKFVSTSFDGNSDSNFAVSTNMDALTFGLWYHF